MAGDEIDHLRRSTCIRSIAIEQSAIVDLRMIGSTDDTILDRFEMTVDISGSITGLLFVEGTAFQPVTKFIVEYADTFHLPDIFFYCPLFEGKGRVGCYPAFAVYEDGRIDLQEFTSQAVHRLDIMYAHQVEAEAVDMIFPGPEFDRFDDIMSHHFAFRGCLVSATGSVGIRTVGVLPVKISGNSQVEIRMVGRCRVVIDHIEYNAETVLMQAFHHLFKFADTDDRISRICRITSIGNIVILRVISPVVMILVQFCFIYSGKIERR